MKNNMRNSKKTNQIDKKRLGIFALILVAIIAVVVVIVIVANSGAKKIKADMGTEIWLNAGEEASLKNGEDNISLKIDSDLNYKEGEAFKLEYTLVVNDTEYKGEYTFGVGYSIHSEPNNIPYGVSFKNIENGKVSVSINEKTK